MEIDFVFLSIHESRLTFREIFRFVSISRLAVVFISRHAPTLRRQDGLRALGRCEKRALPGERESGPKARRPINDQAGADSRHSRGYLLQLTDSAWYLRGAKVLGEETAKKKKK